MAKNDRRPQSAVTESVSRQAWYRNTASVQVVTMIDGHQAPTHCDNGSSAQQQQQRRRQQRRRRPLLFKKY